MQDNISPEEKLLDLIKKGKDNIKDIPPEQPKQEKSAEGPVAPIGVPKKIRIRYASPFSILNKFLIIAVICAIVYMVFAYKYPYKPETEISSHVEIEKGEGAIGETPKPLPPVSHYMDIMSRRQMFKLYEVPKPKPQGPTKPKVTLQQLLAGYTFVGVIFGDVPQAIVEEKKTGQSFYLTAGQFLGEIKIEKIERGRITVSYEDESMDISI